MLPWTASYPCPCQWPWLNPAGHKQKHKTGRGEVEGSLTGGLVRIGGWYQTTEDTCEQNAIHVRGCNCQRINQVLKRFLWSLLTTVLDN